MALCGLRFLNSLEHYFQQSSQMKKSHRFEIDNINKDKTNIENAIETARTAEDIGDVEMGPNPPGTAAATDGLRCG
jgi:hypothetical protein